VADERILVVDDDPAIRGLAVTVLAGEGYDVREAASGIEAFDVLERDGCALVLLDINMPGLDGWQTLRMIRAHERLAATPVVMFSVKAELRDKVTSLQEGATDYLPKPFHIDDLVRRVRAALDAAPASRGGEV
jgi:two-component system OmpR family response regulator